MDKRIDSLIFWLNGPKFLWKLKALWPQFPIKVDAQIPKKFSPFKTSDRFFQYSDRV